MAGHLNKRKKYASSAPLFFHNISGSDFHLSFANHIPWPLSKILNWKKILKIFHQENTTR